MGRLFDSEIEDLKVILRDSGSILVGLGGLCLLPVLIALVYGEYLVIPSFLIASIISLGIGLYLRKRFHIEKPTELRHAFIISGLVWLLIALIGALPFVVSGVFSNFLDALFESMAGFTTTGLTLIWEESNLDPVPKSILFWRSLQQYVGGAGFIILAITVFIGKGAKTLRLHRSEGMAEEVLPSILDTGKIVIKLYIFFMLFGALLYKTAGMPLFDSINHAMTSISTGGMSINEENLAFYHNSRAELVSVILMLLGATNILLLYEIIKGNLKEITENLEVKVGIIILALVLMTTVNGGLLQAFYPVKEIVRVNGYNTVSALTTGGFMILSPEKTAGLAAGSKVVLILLMILGGGICSTAGGIKLLRLGVVIKTFYWKIRRLAFQEQNSSKIHNIEEASLEEEDLAMVFYFTLLYLLAFVVSGLVVSSFGYNVIDSFFETASAIGNVGLTTGITATAPAAIKVLYIFDMWLGRLEIWAVLITITYLLSKAKVSIIGR